MVIESVSDREDSGDTRGTRIGIRKVKVRAVREGRVEERLAQNIRKVKAGAFEGAILGELVEAAREGNDAVGGIESRLAGFIMRFWKKEGFLGVLLGLESQGLGEHCECVAAAKGVREIFPFIYSIILYVTTLLVLHHGVCS